jgi:O-antigen/teichoic acid export membrane protein
MFQKFNTIKIRLENVILKDIGLMAISKITILFLSFITTVIISRSLSMESYGYYILILSYVAMGQITTLPGFNLIIQRGGIKDYDRILISSLKRVVPVSIISAIVLAIVGFSLYQTIELTQLGLLLMFTALALPLYGLEQYEALLTGKREYKIIRFVLALKALLMLIIVGGVAYYTKNEFWTYLSLLVLQIFMLMIGYLFVKNKWKNSEINTAYEKESIDQAWKYTWVMGFNRIVKVIDRVILGAISPSMLAMYHIGSLIPKQISNIFKVIIGVLNTYWGNEKKEGNAIKITKYLWTIFFTLLFLTIISWILIPFVIELFFGEGYSESSKIAQWLVLSTPLKAIAALLFGFDIYQKDGSFYRKQQVFKSVTYLLLLLPLVYFYQISGIIIAILITDVVFGIIAIIYFYKTNGHNETKKT